MLTALNCQPYNDIVHTDKNTPEISGISLVHIV